MVARIFLLSGIAVAGTLFGSSGALALGLRCGSRIVNDGMLAAQVNNRCGTPFWTEEFTSIEILGAGGPVEEQREVDWQVWYYNFGSNMLMQRLVFRDGQLQTVEALGYGFAELGRACITGPTARGLTTGELVARCGEPASRTRRDGVLVRRMPGVVRANEERREEWIYNLDERYLTRYFINNGRVTDIDRVAQ